MTHTMQWLAAAVLTQQFVVLIAIAMVLMLPKSALRPFLLAAGVAGASVLVPLGVVTSGRLFTDLSGRFAPTVQSFNTWLRYLHVTGSPLWVLSRLVPLVIALGVCTLARRKLDLTNDSGATLLSLVGVALSIRLLFELNLYGYYFLALLVVLVLSDTIAGRLRPLLVFWALLEIFFFNPPSFVPTSVAGTVPVWMYQALTAGGGLLLAASPLFARSNDLRHVTAPRSSVDNTSGESV